MKYVGEFLQTRVVLGFMTFLFDFFFLVNLSFSMPYVCSNHWHVTETILQNILSLSLFLS